LPRRRDRREEILERLRWGPASAQELAEDFSISREGVLRWLRMLETDGKIRATAASRTSRTNRWVLTDGQSATHEAPAPQPGDDP
jgi:predicted ArsR family transcriptional regulator